MKTSIIIKLLLLLYPYAMMSQNTHRRSTCVPVQNHHESIMHNLSECDAATWDSQFMSATNTINTLFSSL